MNGIVTIVYHRILTLSAKTAGLAINAVPKTQFTIKNTDPQRARRFPCCQASLVNAFSFQNIRTDLYLHL